MMAELRVSEHGLHGVHGWTRRMGLPSDTCSAMPAKDESPLLFGDLTEKIIGAFYRVHRDLGYGHAEVVY